MVMGEPISLFVVDCGIGRMEELNDGRRSIKGKTLIAEVPVLWK
jgi:hypothetical protein